MSTATAPAAHCGYINTETGEFREGYTAKNGELRYRNPLPWWRRLFGAKDICVIWSEWEYVGTREIDVEFTTTYFFADGFSTSIERLPVKISRKTHLYTGKRRYRIRSRSNVICREIDAEEFERNGTIISL